jgi:hypothetical protein
MTKPAATIPLRLARRTVLEFAMADGRAIRVPAPMRGQINRCQALEAEAKTASTLLSTDPLQNAADPLQNGPEQFCGTIHPKKAWRAFSEGSAPTGGDDVGDLLKAQLGVLLEGSGATVEEFTTAEQAQMLYALAAVHYGHDAAFAATVAVAHLATTLKEEAA